MWLRAKVLGIVRQRLVIFALGRCLWMYWVKRHGEMEHPGAKFVCEMEEERHDQTNRGTGG